MILHFSHIGLTDGRTFMIPFGSVTGDVALGAAAGTPYQSRTPARTPDGAARTGHDSNPGLAPRIRPGGAPGGYATPFSCHGVRTRGPSGVTAIVNSKCAASEPSCEKIVQPSSLIRTWWRPALTIGSTARTIPSSS